MDLSLKLENTHVLVTGGSGYIGTAVVEAFLSAGAFVTSFDLKPPNPRPSGRFQYLKCDITDESALVEAFAEATIDFGLVQCCIALASLDLSVLEHHESMASMSLEQWRRTHKVNVEGTFLTARTWMRGLMNDELRAIYPMKNISLIVVGSESGRFGERGNADYAAGKSAVQGGLVSSLMGDIVKIWSRARVNAVAPGPVATVQFWRECVQNPNQLWLDAQAT
jgi:NAD(P)-dependent dehydrogenase (short-subunit alcohol dehydrogenase family)